jgi:hypothetical protein
MSARVRPADNALRDSVASMGSMQLALTAREIGVSASTLKAYAEARTSLPSHTMQRLVDRLYRGAYLVKKREESA